MASGIDLSSIINDISNDKRYNKKLNAAQDAAIAQLVENAFSTESGAVVSRARHHVASLDDIAADIAVDIMREKHIDLYNIYCRTTGAKIGRMDEHTIKLVMQVHENDAMRETVMAYSLQTAIAAHWIYTGPAQLDALATLDPCGYFVYCASKIIRRDPQNPVDAKEMQTALYQNELLRDKILLNRYLQTLSIEHIIAANEAWRTFLSICSPTRIKYVIQWPYANISQFCQEGTVEKLPKQLMTMLGELVKREDRTKRRVHLSAANLQNMKENYGGNSALGLQGKSRGLNEAMDLMANFNFYDDELEQKIDKILADTRAERLGRRSEREAIREEMQISIAGALTRKAKPADTIQTAKPVVSFFAKLKAKTAPKE